MKKLWILLATVPFLLSWNTQPEKKCGIECHGDSCPAVSHCAFPGVVGPNNHRPAYYGRDDGCLWIPPGTGVPGDEWMIICDIARVDIY